MRRKIKKKYIIQSSLLLLNNKGKLGSSANRIVRQKRNSISIIPNEHFVTTHNLFGRKRRTGSGTVIPYALRLLGDDEIKPTCQRNKNIIQLLNKTISSESSTKEKKTENVNQHKRVNSIGIFESKPIKISVDKYGHVLPEKTQSKEGVKISLIFDNPALNLIKRRKTNHTSRRDSLKNSILKMNSKYSMKVDINKWIQDTLKSRKYKLDIVKEGFNRQMKVSYTNERNNFKRCMINTNLLPNSVSCLKSAPNSITERSLRMRNL